MIHDIEQPINEYNILDDDIFDEIDVTVTRSTSVINISKIGNQDVYNKSSHDTNTNSRGTNSHGINSTRNSSSHGHSSHGHSSHGYSNCNNSSSGGSSHGSSNGSSSNGSSNLSQQSRMELYDIQNNDFDYNNKKISCADIQNSIKKHLVDNKYSNELDILIIYIQGQKHVYTQSYYLTQQKINLILYSTLLVSGSLIFVAPYIQQFVWSGWIISVLNIFLTICVSMLSFFSLYDNKNKYNNMANQYSKLYQILNISRNNILLDTPEQKNHVDIINTSISNAVNYITNIKDDNLIIPIEIKQITPIISNINIFTFIQKINRKQVDIIIQYREVKNNIRYIFNKWKKSHHTTSDRTTTTITDGLTIDKITDYNKQLETKRMEELLIEKKILKARLLSQQMFVDIENVFITEIQQSSIIENKFMFIFCSYAHYLNCFSCYDHITNTQQTIDDIVQRY